MSSKVSIIIPAYNVSMYIDATIKSCIEQTYKNIEILIINDGSEDNTLEIIEKYIKLEPRIKVITISNHGLSVARNIGIEMATGKYIMFLDGDDWIEKELVSQCVANMRDDLDVFYFNAIDCIEDDRKNIERKEEQKYVLTEKICDGHDIFEIGINHPIRHEAWRGCYSKNFLDNNNIRFIPGMIYEDNSFWFDVMLTCEKIKYLNIYGYNYRQRRDSIVNTHATLRNVESVLLLSEYILRKIYSESYNSSIFLTGSNKIVDLIRGCEKKIATNSLLNLEIEKENIINKKEKLFEIIYSFHDFETPEAFIKSKYYLCSHLCFFVGIYTKDMLITISTLREEMIQLLKRKFMTWPLQKSKNKVGIYGSGRNADVILGTYRKICGEIDADYIYIDSKEKSMMKKHLNRDILNVSDVNAYNIKDIIVCSVYYENEMYNTLIENRYRGDIYRVYDGDVVNLEGLLVSNFYEFYNKLIITEQDKRLFLIGTPEYPNIGDHLIALAEYAYFKEWFSEYTIIEISNTDYLLHKTKLKRFIKKDDLLIVTGGGFLGSLWTDGHYDEVIDLVEGYPDNEIIIMPQSIYFSDNELGSEYIKRTQKMFLCNNNLKICLREKFSYNRLVNIIGNSNRLRLFPDIALFYNLNKRDFCKENTIGVFLRDDKESILTKKQKRQIEKMVEEFGRIGHFSMHYHAQILPEDRYNAVMEKINEIGRYKLVVTDALHCMIICAMTNVPCVAINNISYKVEGVYIWLKEKKNIILYDKNNIQSLHKCIVELLDNECSTNNMEFLNKYWEELNAFIRETVD